MSSHTTERGTSEGVVEQRLVRLRLASQLRHHGDDSLYSVPPHQFEDCGLPEPDWDAKGLPKTFRGWWEICKANA